MGCRAVERKLFQLGELAGPLWAEQVEDMWQAGLLGSRALDESRL